MSVTTWSLEMTDPAELRRSRLPAGDLRLLRVTRPNPAYNKFLYNEVGREWRVAYRSSSFTSLRAAIRSGLAVGVLPHAFKYPDRAAAWIPRPPRPWDDPSRAADYMAGIARLAPAAVLRND